VRWCTGKQITLNFTNGVDFYQEILRCDLLEYQKSFGQYEFLTILEKFLDILTKNIDWNSTRNKKDVFF